MVRPSGTACCLPCSASTWKAELVLLQELPQTRGKQSGLSYLWKFCSCWLLRLRALLLFRRLHYVLASSLVRNLQENAGSDGDDMEIARLLMATAAMKNQTDRFYTTAIVFARGFLRQGQVSSKARSEKLDSGQSDLERIASAPPRGDTARALKLLEFPEPCSTF